MLAINITMKHSNNYHGLKKEYDVHVSHKALCLSTTLVLGRVLCVAVRTAIFVVKQE